MVQPRSFSQWVQRYITFLVMPYKNGCSDGFAGLCSVFVTAAFAFAGTELVGLAAAETANPRKSLPTAVKQVFWRILLFYIVSLTLIGLLVGYDNPRLLSGEASSDAKASPFVISIQEAGITGLPSVMNVVIMISVLSVGNSSIYGSSRTLAALAEQRQAPRFLAYIDRKGRPLFAILIASGLGFLAFLGASSKQQDAFNWMLALSGLSSIFTWGSICLAHMRFRQGWIHQGHSLDELAFRSQPGFWGSAIGFGFNVLVLIAQFWTGFAPVGYSEMTTSDLIINFFQAYLAAPIVVAFYVPYKIYFKTPFLTVDKMDLRTGRRDLDLGHLLEEERAEKAAWPTWKKVYKWFC
jgi:yeast amino acid transporter